MSPANDFNRNFGASRWTACAGPLNRAYLEVTDCAVTLQEIIGDAAQMRLPMRCSNLPDVDRVLRKLWNDGAVYVPPAGRA
jgi:hypothetical protein